MELKGKSAIVTGAARGIGRGIALKLAASGANVALVDLGNPKEPALTYDLAAQAELLATTEELRGRGVKAIPILADVTRLADCQRMADETVRALGSIDVLVNNAGIVAVGTVADMPEEAWDRVMAVNAKGPFLCSKACIPYLLKNREGAIVNIASIVGKTGYPALSAYCASKFSVIALTQALAHELGPSNVRVNAICPGLLRTAMWTGALNKHLSSLWGGAEQDFFEQNVARLTALRREQTPDDIGEAVAYLARADNVTGTALVVAGGAELH
jgi:meso-butanediol dehydrogenase / (S,S)-butanediol dehydrogenase / diacetyl reductase